VAATKITQGNSDLILLPRYVCRHHGVSYDHRVKMERSLS